MRILLVDDLPDANEMLEHLFRLWSGYEVHSATRGIQALVIARVFRPDVVILDIGMPDMNGHELARRLRGEHGTSLKIICLSGYGQEGEIQLAKEAGGDHFFLKPANPNEIRKVMEECRACPVHY